MTWHQLRLELATTAIEEILGDLLLELRGDTEILRTIASKVPGLVSCQSRERTCDYSGQYTLEVLTIFYATP